MNYILVGICALLVCIINLMAAECSKAAATTPTTTKFSSITKLANFKETEKLSYPKKVNSSKKNHAKLSRKKIADNIADKFRDLPDDDLTFIMELDKQFKLHGGSLKIKVENKNVTETKNTKRTIDGELGYGYAHNGYDYEPPKFMFYPYSQHNIRSDAPGYFPVGEGKTKVSIEPSYSYELKSQSYLTQRQPQIDVPKVEPPSDKHVEVAQQHYEEPVIVLRIPGPAKYATHLQTLLQKYLEIRAAQYLHILEEAEQANIQQQQQQQQHLQQLDYGHVTNTQIDQPQQHHAAPDPHIYTQTYEYHQQNVASPAAEQYPEIDHVYHSYKNRHSTHQGHVIQQPLSYYATQQQNVEAEQHQPQYPEHQDHYQYQQHQQPQFYYAHQQEYAQPEGPPANTYHQVLLVTMTQPQQHVQEPAIQEHEQEQEEESAEETPQQPIYGQEQKEPTLTVPITENNPRPSHTKVVFTNKKEHPSHDYQMYQLPSIKPNERHAPTSTPDFHQDFHHQPAENLNTYQHQYTVAADSAASQPKIVTITQRPYNYHAHNVKARARGGRLGHARRAITTKETDHGLEKSHEYGHDKLGAETTQIIDG